MIKKILVFFPLVSFAMAVFSDSLVLPTVFSDHMVLQRNRSVPVWGTAEAGAKITVEFARQKKESVADDSGKWRVTLDPMPASSDPREITISSSLDTRHVTLSDILVGEVWLCSGQSNMQMPLKGWSTSPIDNAVEEVAAADWPEIRLYNTPRIISRAPRETIDAQWKICMPETAEGFSACAYYFGWKLHQDLHVPVGLLLSCWSGTMIEPWIPPCGFERIDSLKDIAGEINNIPEVDNGSKEDRRIPTVIYNGMLAANIPFAIRGAIWYQGESNRTEGMLYVDKTKALLNGWRHLWGYDFPFYFVQLAPYQSNGQDPEIYPLFWEAQSAIVRTIPNTGMAVISDVTTLDKIHPSNKKTPGIRLALLAEANTYGMDVVSTGPVFQSLEKRDSRLNVIFSSAAGLTTRDEKAPDWFEIAGKDDVFKPADAVIQGDSVLLSSPDIKAPFAVRFAWNKIAVPNLMNGAGLPASSFRARLK